MTLSDLRQLAYEQTWRDGEAHLWALDTTGPTGGQQRWRADFWATPPLGSTVWNIGRQRGKTHAAVFINVEAGSIIPDAALRYCAKTKDSALGIFMPAFDLIVATMPEDMRPNPAGSDRPWRKGLRETEWAFPLGGILYLFGTDAQSFAKGRGPRSHIITLDEAGFYQDLPAVEAALLPSLQTTGGRVLYPSTPAESVGHPYTLRIHAAKASGQYQHDTFWNNPRVDHEAVIREEAKRLGMAREVFMKNTYFRREFLAEVVTDESRAAMPAWTDELAAVVVGEWERPTYFDGYQAHDPGIEGDPHASLFAWHDPARNEVVIEAEIELRSAPTTIKAWTEDIKALETELYGSKSWDGTLLGAEEWLKDFKEVPEYLQKTLSKGAARQPYLRVGDNAQGVCKEMTLTHNLALMPTDKHEKAFHVDSANQLLAEGRVRIHKRCVRLIEQLYSTVWNKTRSAWERTDKDHGDLIDDFVYLLRNVNWNRDCRPKHTDSATKAIQAIQKRASSDNRSWEDAFRRQR